MCHVFSPSRAVWSAILRDEYLTPAVSSNRGWSACGRTALTLPRTQKLYPDVSLSMKMCARKGRTFLYTSSVPMDTEFFFSWIIGARFPESVTNSQSDHRARLHYKDIKVKTHKNYVIIINGRVFYSYLLFLFQKGHGWANCTRLGKKIESTSLHFLQLWETHLLQKL